MDGLSVLFGILTIVLLGVILGMNTISSLGTSKETFIDQSPSNSQVEVQIRTVLDRMAVPELCPLFQKVRENIRRNEATGQKLSDQELTSRVEKTLALGIPGGALPCPLFTYPRAGSSDLEWLDFLQKIPSDFGARVVFMALYARNQLVKTQITLDSNLKRMKNKDIKLLVSQATGEPPEPLTEEEIAQDKQGFEPLCPPDVADTRRAERANKVKGACALPEDLSPQQIQEAVTELLKTLVATKDTTLKAKGVDPTIDIRPLIEQANKAAAALDVRKQQVEAGTLRLES